MSERLVEHHAGMAEAHAGWARNSTNSPEEYKAHTYAAGAHQHASRTFADAIRAPGKVAVSITERAHSIADKANALSSKTVEGKAAMEYAEKRNQERRYAEGAKLGISRADVDQYGLGSEEEE